MKGSEPIQRAWLQSISTRSRNKDLVVLAILSLVLLAGLRALQIPWWEIDPSPLLLFPLLLGAWHGLACGGGAGLWCLSLYLFGHCGLDFTDWIAMLHDNPWHTLAFILFGAVAGECHRLFYKASSKQQVEVAVVRDRLRQMDEEVFVLREARDELERALAASDSEMLTLDIDIRRLFQSPPDEVWADAMRLLTRQARISEGAIYFLEQGVLVRRALNGDDEKLPSRLPVEQWDLVNAAVQRRTIISLPEMWGDGKVFEQDVLVACPMLDGTGEVFAVLVVSRLPFIAANKRTVYRINLICRLIALVLEGGTREFRFVGGAGRGRVYGIAYLKDVLETCWKIHESYGLPSSLVPFHLDNATEGQLEQLIVPSLRAGDVAAVSEDVTRLWILLPLTDERGASIFLNRTLKAVEAKVVGARIEGKVVALSAMGSWKELVGASEL